MKIKFYFVKIKDNAILQVEANSNNAKIDVKISSLKL